MCVHGLYAGTTATDDEILMDCPRCEKRRDWDEETRRDFIDEMDEMRSARYDGIYDDEDRWY